MKSEIDILLKGFSGCTISVRQAGTSYRLIKSTKDKEYIPRLKKQAEKQIAYDKLNLPEAFRIPKIYNIKDRNDSISIEMEYINCLDVISYLSYANHGQITWLRDSLIDLNDFFLSQSEIHYIDSKKLFEKLNTISSKLKKHKKSKLFLPIVRQVSKELDNLPEKISIPIGYCHGDLTFSNILIDPATPAIILIDFLDSFMETPLIDMVKIRQDTSHGWTRSIYKNQYPGTRLKTIMKYMDEGLDKHFRKNDFYTSYYKYFQLLNLVRILPYLSDKKLIELVFKAIKTELR